MIRLFVIGVGIAWAVIMAGCCVQFPAHCRARPHALEDKLRMIQPRAGRAEIGTANFTFGPERRPVFIAEPPAGVRHAPPVLLLHEMPALSADALELAQRIAGRGYRVYVPLLFGDIHDDPENGLLPARRWLGYATDPKWKAAFSGNAHMGIADDLLTLCRSNILPLHKRQRLGVVGLCISGALPLALAARLPEVAAPVLSQPAIPLIACGADGKRSLGLSPEELSRIKGRAATGWQVLGFRFEGDRVSPPERFQRLREELGPHAFIDATLRASRYEKVDCLPYRAHAVLTSCYQRWAPPAAEPATHLAFRQLVWFLDSKLKGKSVSRPE
jgi:dienelactone hydrolase